MQIDLLDKIVSILPNYFLNVATHKRPSGLQHKLLYIFGTRGVTERYRCSHPISALRPYYKRIDKIDMQNILDDSNIEQQIIARLKKHYDTLILMRVQYNSVIAKIIKVAYDSRCLVIFDTDDLIFSNQFVEHFDNMRVTYKHIDTRKKREQFVDKYRNAMKLCHHFTCSTGPIKDEIELNFTGKISVVRNAFSFKMFKISANALRNKTKQSDKIVIGYSSGTATHDRDLESITASLQYIMNRFRNVHLLLLGHLNVPSPLLRFSTRIESIPFMDWTKLPYAISKMDINIAPLEDDIFSNAKSELKYFEAALVKVPTIASPRNAFNYAIEHGYNGLLAQTTKDWDNAFTKLITQPNRRKQIGVQAFYDASKQYSPAKQGKRLNNLINLWHKQLS